MIAGELKPYRYFCTGCHENVPVREVIHFLNHGGSHAHMTCKHTVIQIAPQLPEVKAAMFREGKARD